MPSSIGRLEQFCAHSADRRYARLLLGADDEIMEKLPSPALWLIILCIVVLAGAGVFTSITLGTVSPETLRGQILDAIWLNVAVQFVLLIAGIYLVQRLFRGDRQQRASKARTRNLADLALLSGGLAHEMRNHLHALQSRVGLLRKATRDDHALSTRVEKLDEIIQAMEELLNDFLTYARPAADELEDLDAAELIKSVTEFEALDLERANIRLELELEQGVHLLVDRRKFQRALLNLVVNARQAMLSGGTLSITCRENRSGVEIIVRDTGDGISPTDMPRVFESYFTTKSEGTGLGLAIVQRTIEDLGGRVGCSSQIGRGTSFTIELPNVRRVEAPLALAARQFSESHGEGT